MSIKTKLVALGLSLSLIIGGVTTAWQTPKAFAAADYTYTKEQIEAVNYINAIRAKMGFTAVELDPFLTKAAQNHAYYNTMNHDNTLGAPDKDPDEDPGKIGFTGVEPWQRYIAAGGLYETESYIPRVGEVTHFGTSDLKSAIDSWLTTPYQRASFSKDIEKVGIAASGTTVVMNLYYSPSNHADAVLHSIYPYDGQTGVYTVFYDNGIPNHFKQFDIEHSDTIIFFQGSGLIDGNTIKTSLVDSNGKTYELLKETNLFDAEFFNAELSAELFDAELLDDDHWYFYPRGVLADGETYTFSISYHDILENEDVSKTWSFTIVDPVAAAAAYDAEYLESHKNRPGPSSSISAIVGSETSPEDVIDTTVIDTTKAIKVSLNGVNLVLNPVPVMKNNSTFIPLRGVFEKMGANLVWDSKYKAVNIKQGATRIVLYVGSKSAFINGKDILLAQAPFIKNNSVFVPLRFISESIGASVTWDAKKLIAGIITK